MFQTANHTGSPRIYFGVISCTHAQQMKSPARNEGNLTVFSAGIMDRMPYERDLEENGWAIVPGVLTREEIDAAKDSFFSWKDSIPGLKERHDSMDAHGIFRHYEASRPTPNHEKIVRIAS